MSFFRWRSERLRPGHRREPYEVDFVQFHDVTGLVRQDILGELRFQTGELFGDRGIAITVAALQLRSGPNKALVGQFEKPLLFVVHLHIGSVGVQGGDAREKLGIQRYGGKMSRQQRRNVPFDDAQIFVRVRRRRFQKTPPTLFSVCPARSSASMVLT